MLELIIFAAVGFIAGTIFGFWYLSKNAAYLLSRMSAGQLNALADEVSKERRVASAKRNS